VLKYPEESKIRDARSEYTKKAAILLVSAVLHGLLFYALLQVKSHYRIYRYDKSGVATVVLLSKDAVSFPRVPKSGTLFPPGPEPLIIRPGRTAAGTAAQAAAPERPVAKAEPASPAGGGGGAVKAGAPGPPPVESKAEAGAERTGAAPPGVSSGFGLTYPLGSQLKLTKPAETSIDEILRPGRYRTRTDIDFSKYLRPEPGAKVPSGRMGIGTSGTSGTGGGQGPGRGASVTMNVARYDLVPWATGVMTKIQRNWTLTDPEDSGYRAEVRVAVMMSRNGDLLAVEIATSSKLEALDQAAIRALQASGPFPALPADFPKSTLDMVFVFQYGY
jgi:TonB family protein